MALYTAHLQRLSQTCLSFKGAYLLLLVSCYRSVAQVSCSTVIYPIFGLAIATDYMCLALVCAFDQKCQ